VKASFAIFIIILFDIVLNLYHSWFAESCQRTMKTKAGAAKVNYKTFSSGSRLPKSTIAGVTSLCIQADQSSNFYTWRRELKEFLFKNYNRAGNIIEQEQHYFAEVSEDASDTIIELSEKLATMTEEASKIRPRIPRLSAEIEGWEAALEDSDEDNSVNGLDKKIAKGKSDLLQLKDELETRDRWIRRYPYRVEIEKENLKLVLKKTAERNSKYEDTLNEVYQVIWQSITRDSQERLRQKETWVSIEQDKDPLDLYLLAKEVHSTTVLPSTERLHHDRLFNLINMKQERGEALCDYSIRFEYAREALESTGQTVPAMDVLVAGFIRGLDDRYSEVRNTIDNNMLYNRKSYPKTVSAVMMIASQYKVSRPTANNNMQAAYVATAKGKKPNATKQTTVDKQPVNIKQPANIKQPVQKKPEGVATAGVVAAKPNGVNGAKEQRVCWNCGEEGHLRTNCKKPPKAAYTTEVEYEDDEDVHVSDDYEDDEEFGIFTLTTDECTDKSQEVLLDNGASTSIFCNCTLLTDIRTVPQTITFRGLSGKVTTNKQGVFRHYGLVWFCEQASANLLSWTELLSKNMIISYHPGSDEFRVNHDVFTRTSTGLYALTERGLHVTRDYYSKRDVAKAKEALSIWENVGPIGPNKVKYLLRGNQEGVQPKHIDLAIKLFGTPKALDLGRATPPVPLTDRGNPVFVHGNQELTMFCDVMETMQHLFFVSRAKPIGLAMSTYLGMGKGARLSGRLLKAFQIQTAVLASHNFIVKRAVMDGESGLRACQNDIRGKMKIQVTFVTTTHVPEAEALIRELKYFARGVYNVLPYILPHSWVPDLISCATQRLNILVTDAGLSGVPPIEALTGIVVITRLKRVLSLVHTHLPVLETVLTGTVSTSQELKKLSW
jgi:hypothetical protein